MSLKQPSGEAHENIKRHGLVRLLATVALSLAAIYVAYSIISANIAIRDNLKKYDELAAETSLVLENNEQINAYLENDENLDEYIENIARDKLDYANSDERIYYVIPASAD
ncbi:MAG: septum formation initiator family protein [Oscillospiraceae bacterium]|nr:septum formation initiator family protein [Oscillospiraceae bacterium]